MIFGRRLVRCSSLLAAGSFLRMRGTAAATAIFTATVFRRAAVFLPCRQILVHFGKLAVGTTSSPGFHHRRRRRDRFHGISSGIFSFPQNTPFFHTLHRSSQTNKISLPKLKWHPAGTTHFHTAVGHKPPRHNARRGHSRRQHRFQSPISRNNSSQTFHQLRPTIIFPPARTKRRTSRNRCNG